MNTRLKKFPFFLPFAGCRGQCVYCNQRAITGVLSVPSPEYVRSELSRLTEPREVCYFGGSFCRFPQETVKEYLDAVAEAAPLGSTIRFSTYPGDLSCSSLRHMVAQYPVSCVELGIPTLDRDVLASCKREADPDAIINDIQTLMSDGFRIGVQIMIGLPGQTRENVLRTLEILGEVKGRRVWDLRLYPCLVIKGTELEAMWRDGKYTPMTVENAVLLGGEFIERAYELGFVPIRIGLQETESLMRECVAGPHEPALGELILAEAEARGLAKKDDWLVPRRNISRFTGHNKFGLKRLAHWSGLPISAVKAKLKLTED